MEKYKLKRKQEIIDKLQSLKNKLEPLKTQLREDKKHGVWSSNQLTSFKKSLVSEIELLEWVLGKD